MRTRASTGKAVTDMAVPRKVAKATKEISLPATVACSSYSTGASATPRPNDRTMDDMETPAASPACGRTRRFSNSQPTTNMKRTSPTWATADSSGRTSAGKRRSDRSPGSSPRTLGPSRMPAVISPTTAG